MPKKQSGTFTPLPGRPTGKPAVTGTANAVTRGQGKKKGLLKKIAKTTGTTTGEARGIMKNVRGAVASGNKKVARKTLTQALKGGPSAGVKRSPARTAKARVTSKKVVRRISARQAGTGSRTKPTSTRKAY